MNPLVLERILLVQFTLHKHSGMIPISGGLISFSLLCFLLKAFSIRFVYGNIAKHQVASRFPKSIYRCTYSVRFVSVSTVYQSDNIPCSQTDSLVHGIINPFVRFTDNMILYIFFLEAFSELFRLFDRLVFTFSVNDPIFQILIILHQYGLNRTFYFRFTIVCNRHNRYFHKYFFPSVLSKSHITQKGMSMPLHQHSPAIYFSKSTVFNSSLISSTLNHSVLISELYENPSSTFLPVGTALFLSDHTI